MSQRYPELMADDRRHPELIDPDEWLERVNAAIPTRADDTLVIRDGKRATLDELLAYIAEDEASRTAGG